MYDKSIKKLVSNNLCYQCGTCESICPTKAIKMTRLNDKGYIYPVVDENKCVNCGKCKKVCPINNIDYNENHLPSDKDFIGIYNCTDKERFDFTASGGIVTEIIKYLFKNEIINKAIVTGMDKEKNTDSKVYVVKSGNELKEVSGSVYQPVSVNTALNEISKEDRVAFVGLPCHIRGLNLFLKEKTILNKSIFIKIGLICTIGRGKHGTNLTLKKSFNIKDFSKIKKIIYRYGMPPGRTRVYLENNTKKEMSCMEIYKNTDYIFMPKGCLFCNDLFNDQADITVGDPWGMNKGKKAMAIVRNEKVKNILDQMINENMLVFDEKITKNQCINTQRHSVVYKIYNYNARISAYKKVNVSMPKIKNIEYTNNSFKEELGYNLLMLNSLFFNTKFGFNISKIIPKKMLYKYRDKVSGINTKHREV